MSDIREKIENHLKLSDRVKEAVAEFFKENKEESVVTQRHFDSEKNLPILCDFFDKKINIIKHKNEYLEMKEKVENAVKEITSSKISEVAKKCSISCQTLYEEYQEFKKLGKSYAYDDKIPNSDVFTYRKERSLFLTLDSWKKKSTKVCRCRYCALEHLFKLASTKNQNPSKGDSHKQAEQWLYEFEMRYSEEISEYSSCCRKYHPLAPTSPSQPSLSYNVTNILEPHTSSKHQTFEQIELENDPKNMQEMIKIHKRSDIRERIINLLNLTKQFMPAVEKYLAKKDNLETVLQKYQINSIDERRILHNIIFILEEHDTYLQEKINYQNAVRLTRSNVTVEDAAQQCNINPVLLDKEIENYKLLYAIRKHKYEYNKIICTSGYLNITYMEEYLLLKELNKWRRNPQLRCSCRFCALEHLYNLITAIITNYNQQKGKSLNLNKIKQLTEEWFCEFQIRYRNKISNFKYNCEKRGISWLITWHKFLSLLDKEKVSKTNISSPHMQGHVDSLQISNDDMMSIREKIEDHLKLSNRLEKAAEKVVNKKENEETIGQKYGFNSKKDRETLDEKIKIKNKKNQYLTLRNKIHKIFYLMETKNPSRLKEIISIPSNTLRDETVKYKESRITYKYDDYVSSYKTLTYNDEISLLEKLYMWKDMWKDMWKTQSCTCQACALENVFYLNYIFANINELEPQIWKNEMIRGNWICEFEMRYTAEMSKFLDYSKCKKNDKFLTSLSAPQFSTSLALEPSTSSTIRPQSDAYPQIYNARIQEKERCNKRSAIMNHLSETKWFIRAAEEVVNKKEEVATVAQKYKFNSPEDRNALDKRIDILKKKRKYLELKDKIEKAVKTISSGNITEVAEKYNIDKSILNEEFKKYSALENKDKYIYDPFTSDDKILTYNEESKLLEMLKMRLEDAQKKDSRVSYCYCWFCLLEHICKQVYINTNVLKRTPIQWKTYEQADVNWLYEFEMRHSEEISKYLPFCMTHSLESTSASDSEDGTSEPLQKHSRTHC